jgi:hypothetical protein
MAVHDISLVRRMVLQIFERGPTEEVEAVSVIITAVHAAHPEHAIFRLQECGVELLHLAPEHTDVAVRVVERCDFLDVLDEVIPQAVVLGHDHLHACTYPGRACGAENAGRMSNFKYGMLLPLHIIAQPASDKGWKWHKQTDVHTCGVFPPCCLDLSSQK